MDQSEEFYFLRFEHQPLTAEQLDRLQREVVRQARIARALAVRRMLDAVARSFRRLAAAALEMMHGWWTGYADWSVRRAAVKELRGLDDRTLKDLGLHRSEIESVVHGPVAGVEAGGKVATVLFDKPYARRGNTVAAEQKELVRSTWSMIAPIANAAIGMFYERLFEIDPSTRRLFQAHGMLEQHRKVVSALDAVVRGLDDLGALTPMLEDLGRRHRMYGVTDAHYDSVRAALLLTLQQGLGQAWTPAAAAAWIETYGVVSGAMRRGAQRAAPTDTAGRAKAA